MRARTEAPLLRATYQGLVRKQLEDGCASLFAAYTGLHFHTAWALGNSPAECPGLCPLAGARLSGSPVCQACQPARRAPALSARGEGHHLCFKCHAGLWNCWLPIRVDGLTLGVVCLQALAHTHPASLVPKGSVRERLKVLTRTEFQRAVRLLHLVIEHVQRPSLALAQGGKAELAERGQALLPIPSGLEPKPSVVRTLLNCIAQHYAQPLTLRQCAGQLGMNAAYLSALFSRAVGQSFKRYLTAWRLEHAKALLADPAKNISEVAYAVGYGGENQFRLAFKKATGLSPRAWRQQ